MFLSSSSSSSKKRSLDNRTSAAISILPSTAQQFTAQNSIEEARVAEIVAHSLSSSVFLPTGVSNAPTSSVFISNSLENVNHRLSRGLSTLSSSRDSGLKFVDDLLSIVKETKYLEQKDIAAAEAERLTASGECVGVLRTRRARRRRRSGILPDDARRARRCGRRSYHRRRLPRCAGCARRTAVRGLVRARVARYARLGSRQQIPRDLYVEQDHRGGIAIDDVQILPLQSLSARD